MKSLFPLRLLLCGTAFVWPLGAAGDALSDAFRQAQDAINASRGSSQSGSVDSNARDELRNLAADRAREAAAEKAERARADRVNGLKNEAEAAATRGDAREAARLARESLIEAKDRKFRAALERWIKYLDAYAAKDEARRTASAAIASADAAFKRGDHRGALASYRRALAADPDSLLPEGKVFVQDLAAYVAREDTRAAARAADREARDEVERRNQPEVTKLTAAAQSLIEEHPAEALKKLEGALKLLPDDPRALAAYWWATASLALREQRFEDADAALKSAGNFPLDPAILARLRTRVVAERQRQGGIVQAAFAGVQGRLTPFPVAPQSGAVTGLAFMGMGGNTNAGDQLLSAAATANANGDLTRNFDIGGAAHAGSLPAIKAGAFNMSERVRNDPRMVVETRQLAEFQARRAQLEAEREQLTQDRNAAGAARMAELTLKLDQKNREYQHNLAALAAQEQKVGNVKRTIDAEVEEPRGGAPAGQPAPGG